MVRMCVALAVCVSVCAHGAEPPRPDRGESMSTAAELTIVVDARYVIAMGYGVSWSATVRQVVEGTLPDRQIRLRLLENGDGHLYKGRFRGREEKGVKLRLRRLPKDDIATQGFNAADGTGWELIEIDGT
jgi:hypothetical protein